MFSYVYVTFTLYGRSFQNVPLQLHSYIVVLQPHLCRNINGLGCFPFARHYLGNHYCFLFLRLLRCFSSPGQPSFEYPDKSGWVAPFGYLRVNSYLHLTAAFRSLSRPSSPLRAQASTMRPYFASLKIILSILLEIISACQRSYFLIIGIEKNKGFEPFMDPNVYSSCFIVVPPRLERGTSTLSVQRSNQLSYGTQCVPVVILQAL